MPAADIAGNPYWQRDVRRNYPRPSTFRQSDIAGLLSVGSAANPRIGVGEAGAQQLFVIKEGGAKGVLSQVFEKGGENAISGVLGPGGLPPLPGTGVSWVLDNNEGFIGKYGTPVSVKKLSIGILTVSLGTRAGTSGRYQWSKVEGFEVEYIGCPVVTNIYLFFPQSRRYLALDPAGTIMSPAVGPSEINRSQNAARLVQAP